MSAGKKASFYKTVIYFKNRIRGKSCKFQANNQMYRANDGAARKIKFLVNFFKVDINSEANFPL